MIPMLLCIACVGSWIASVFWDQRERARAKVRREQSVQNTDSAA